MRGGAAGRARRAGNGIWRWGLALALALTLLGGWLPSPRAARAATLTVTSLLDDDGAGCTLREAILAANTDTPVGDCGAGAGADTIAFAVAGTITLTGGELVITSSLTIAGPGAAALTISGNNAGRVFFIADPDDGDDIALAVTIAGVTITGGRAIPPETFLGGEGGGVYARDVSLTVADSTVSGNTAVGVTSVAADAFAPGGEGGGIYLENGTLTVTGSTISGNTASGGTNEVVDSGDASEAGGGNGGGICVEYASVTLSNSTVSGNTAAGGRGEFALGGEGGGIYTLESDNFAMTNTTVSGNTAAGGIGIYIDGSNSGGVEAMGGRGGGIYLEVDEFATIAGGRIELNIAAGATVGDNEDGAFYVIGGGSGGGIYLADDDLTLTGVTVDRNRAGAGVGGDDDEGQGRGGGIYVSGSDRLTLTGATVVSTNVAEGVVGEFSGEGAAGGGIYLGESELIVAGATVSGNTAGGGSGTDGSGYGGAGGGIYAETDQISLVELTLSGNTAEGGTGEFFAERGRGGGIYIGTSFFEERSVTAQVVVPGVPPGTPVIADSTIGDNIAGGGTATGANPDEAEGGHGGGIYVESEGDESTLAIVNTTISGNTARRGTSPLGQVGEGGEGGGLHLDEPESGLVVTVRGTTFVGNVAEVSTSTEFDDPDDIAGHGGGAYADEDTTLILENSTFVGNTVGGAGAAFYAVAGATLTATNVTVSGNSAPVGGGQVAAEAGADLTLTNTIVAAGGAGGNCAGPIGDGGFNLDDANTCAFTAGGSRANTAPLLGPLASNGGPTQTLAPQPGSPAIDTASNFACPATDQRGVARPQGATCDVGAVELPRVAPALTSISPNGTPQGSPTFLLTVNGTDFVAGLSAIRFGDTTLPTTFVSATQLTATVPADQLTTARTVGVTVTTSGPGGGTSNSLPLQVTSPTASPNYTVTVSQVGTGTVNPGTGTYPAGATPAFTATAGAGQVFVGWTLDGEYVGFAATLDFTVNTNRTLVATFVPRPSFGDVSASDADFQAITFLAALGIVNPQGVNGSGNFEPNRAVARAEVAAFIARTFEWDSEFHRNTFPDRCDPSNANCIDDELWNNVAALADYGVVGGYTDGPTCASAGTTAPCYLPRDTVKRIQVASVVARAFIETPDLRPTGFWERLPAVPGQYTNVADAGTQRSDLATYRQNAGPIPGQTSDGTFPDPAGEASRRFVIQTLWQAFNAQFSVDRVP